jgi:hypothetical protein
MLAKASYEKTLYGQLTILCLKQIAHIRAISSFFLRSYALSFCSFACQLQRLLSLRSVLSLRGGQRLGR